LAYWFDNRKSINLYVLTLLQYSYLVWLILSYAPFLKLRTYKIFVNINSYRLLFYRIGNYGKKWEANPSNYFLYFLFLINKLINIILKSYKDVFYDSIDLPIMYELILNNF